MSERFHRRSIRLKGYDYASEGAYYLTICTDQRIPHFGKIANKRMFQNDIGIIAQQCWDSIPEHLPNVDVGQFVVMPNHVHGIVMIRERAVGADNGRPGATDDGQHGTMDNERPGITNDHGSGTTTDNGLDNDDRENASHTQLGADHDRPLRPPTAPPAPANTKRVMPIVPIGSLGRIVRAYKSSVTRIVYQSDLVPRGTKIWQRNYWERIIRDDADHDRIAQYIAENPANWKGDRFNTP